MLDNIEELKNDQTISKGLFDTVVGYLSGLIKKDPVKLKNYGDVLLINEEGQLLILLRSNADDFHPGLFCLPGGKIEDGESPIEGACRELAEETNIKISLEEIEPFKVIKKSECTINYFIGSVDSRALEIFLDAEEHQGYEWINIYDIPNKNFLLDLGDLLCEFFNISVPEATEDNSQELKYTPVELITKGEKIEKSFEELKNSFDKGEIKDEKYLEYYNKLNLIKSDYQSQFETRRDELGNEFTIKRLDDNGHYIKDAHILSTIEIDRYQDFKMRMLSFFSDMNENSALMEMWGLRKSFDSEFDAAEDVDEDQGNDSVDMQQQFQDYLANSFLYKERLYDNDGFRIPVTDELVQIILKQCPSIYVAEQDKLNPLFESNKDIVNGLARKRFEAVLPIIIEFENLYKNLEEEAKNQFTSKQTDFITRTKNIKKILKESFNDVVYNRQLFSLLSYLRLQINNNIDPLLEVTLEKEGEQVVNQIYLSELQELLSAQSEPDGFIGIIDLKVVDFDKYDEFDFNIQFFNPNDAILIQTLCDKVNSKLDSQELRNQPIDEDVVKGDDPSLSEVSKQQSNVETGINLSEAEIQKWAKNTPLEALEEFITLSDDPKLRQIAHDEIARRAEQEEVPEEKEIEKSCDITTLDPGEQIVEETVEPETPKGCLMFFPHVDEMLWIHQLKQMFPEEIVNSYEFEPHVTILYGLLDNQFDQSELDEVVTNYLKSKPIKISLDPISLFQNDLEDIVKIGIKDENGNLTGLNALLRLCFPYENRFDEYRPHMTLCYTKSHEGERYQNTVINPADYGIVNLDLGHIYYSDSEKNKRVVVSYEFEDEIEKARKGVPIGTTQVFSGYKYVKTVDGWKPVKTHKEHIDPELDNHKDHQDKAVSKRKEGEKEEKKPAKEAKVPTHADHAKATPEEVLTKTVTTSEDPKLREAAHNELERRKKEEYPEEVKKAVKPKSKAKKPAAKKKIKIDTSSLKKLDGDKANDVKDVDVNSVFKNKYLQKHRDQWKKLETDYYKKKTNGKFFFDIGTQEMEVSIDDIHPGQIGISSSALENYDENYESSSELPEAIRITDKDGKKIILLTDGHHRVSKDILTGKDKVKLKVKTSEFINPN